MKEKGSEIRQVCFCFFLLCVLCVKPPSWCLGDSTSVRRYPFCAMPNADETFAIMHRRVGEEAARALRGQMPNTPVNPQIRPHLTWLAE